MSTIDKIFKEKLEAMEKTPPPAAWGKVKSNLNESNDKAAYFWYTAAACFVILLMTVFITYNSTQSGDHDLADRRTAPIKSMAKKPAEIVIPVAKNQTELTTAKVEVREKKAKKTLANENKNEKIDKTESDLFNEKSEISDMEIAALNSESVVFTDEEEVPEKEMPEVVNVQSIEVIIKKTKVSTPIDTSEKTKNKWGKAIQQVVNLKNGEKVDLKQFSKLLATNKKNNENSK
jgi:hypothetical protein